MDSQCILIEANAQTDLDRKSFILIGQSCPEVIGGKQSKDAEATKANNTDTSTSVYRYKSNKKYLFSKNRILVSCACINNY